jgi:hypothetical protein
MIGIHNIDIYLERKLLKEFSILKYDDQTIDFSDVDGLIIDWVDKNNKLFIKQAAIIEHYVRKNIPIVIFDRYMSITGKEFSWLKKFNVHFFEPAIKNRCEFEYLPQWMPIGDNEKIPTNKNFHEYDLGYVGIFSDIVLYFEKYYRKYANNYVDRKVIFHTNDSNIEIKNTDSIKLERSKIEYNFNNIILIDNLENIRIGYMREDLYYLMNDNILPLLPRENKYFHGLFKDLSVSFLRDIEYFIRAFKEPGIRRATIDGIFEDIIKYYPEFTIDYAYDKIIGKLK